MNTQTRTRKSSVKPSARLGAYLATGIGASTVAISNSDAAISQIDIGITGFNIGGVNAGLSVGGYRTISAFPVYGSGGMVLNNVYGGGVVTGLDGGSGFTFAITGGNTSPRNFAQNESISAAGFFSDLVASSAFKYGASTSPDFGPGSYMGFKTAQGNYGWLEVTWDSQLAQFEILGGAYEDQPGVAINAGAIPEPSSVALAGVAALVLGGSAYMRSRRRREEDQKEAA